MNCPEDEVIAALASGATPLLEELEQHFDECDSCRHTFATAIEPQSPAEPDLVHLLRPGNNLGRYQLRRVAGVGGMGIVYQAFDPTLQRNVALKVIRPTSKANSSQLLAEAKLMARLNHPHVVTVFDAGEHHSMVFVAMEWVEGETLRDWLQRPHSWRAALALLRQAGLGLSAAHSMGIVHRDFKPENVLISRQGDAKVADFGLALDTQQPAPGSVYGGTLAYLAPETVEIGSVSALVDQFSFCVTAYEALSGQRPEANTPPRAQAKNAPLRCPRYIERAIARGLSREPTARFHSMSQLLKALEPRRHWRWTVLTAMILILLVAAIGWNKQSQDSGCRNADSLLPATWNPQRKNELLQSPHLGHEISTRVGGLIDDFAARWSKAHQTACGGLLHDSFQSWRLNQLKLNCLRHRLNAVDLLLKAVGPQTSSAKLLDATYEAVSLRRCSNVQFLTSGAFEPAQEVLTQEITSARQSLALGTPSSLQKRADRLVEQSKQAKARAIEAEAHLLRALVLAKSRTQLQQTPQIEAELAEAILAGTETNHTYAVAEAELERMRIRVQDGRHEDALQQERTLAAYLKALDSDVLLQIKHDELYGGLLVRLGRLSDAAQIYENARNQLKHLEPAEAQPHYAELLAREGLVQISLGEFPTARKTLEQAVLAGRTAWGTGARLGEALHNLGGLRLLLDHPSECEAPFAQAEEAWRSTFGDQNPRLGINQISWAVCRGIAGHFDEALSLLSKAEMRFTEAQLDKKFYLQRLMCSRAEVERRQGNTVKALRDFEAALGSDASLISTDADTPECALNFSLALSEQKDLRRARKELDALTSKLNPIFQTDPWTNRIQVQRAILDWEGGTAVDSGTLQRAVEALEAQDTFPGIRLRGLVLLASLAKKHEPEKQTGLHRQACQQAASKAGVDTALNKLCETLAPE